MSHVVPRNLGIEPTNKTEIINTWVYNFVFFLSIRFKKFFLVFLHIIKHTVLEMVYIENVSKRNNTDQILVSIKLQPHFEKIWWHFISSSMLGNVVST